MLDFVFVWFVLDLPNLVYLRDEHEYFAETKLLLNGQAVPILLLFMLWKLFLMAKELSQRTIKVPPNLLK
jgi:hypothetical protein